MKLSTVEAFKHIPVTDEMVALEGEKLKTLQNLLLGILIEIDEVCEKHNIMYTLSGGTCLGAIRHRGFIPWDDDIDINMTRAGYQKLVEVFDDELGENYWLHCPETTPNYGLGLARIRKKGTVLKSREDYLIDECGVYVDIFIYEDVPNNPVLRCLHGVVSLALGFALSCRRFTAFKNEYYKLAADNNELMKTFRMKNAIGKLFSFRSMDAWCQSWSRWNSRYHNPDSEYLSIPAGRKHYFGELYKRNLVFPAERKQFESTMMPVPNVPDHYLSKLYGDYMKMPAPEDRELHVVYEFEPGE